MSTSTFFQFDKLVCVPGNENLTINVNYLGDVSNWYCFTTKLFNNAFPHFSNQNICYINFAMDLNDFRIYKLKGIDSTILSKEETPQPPEKEFLIYPNPAGDKVIISIDIKEVNYQLEVFDLIGTKILSDNKFIKIYENSEKITYELDCSSLNQGFYFVRYRAGSISQTVPMVISK